jgi:hypothetical protein
VQEPPVAAVAQSLSTFGSASGAHVAGAHVALPTKVPD